MENIGKYEIIEELGRGAMGKVYKGHDPQIDRYVAIKVISESIQDHPDVIERFQREARAAGKLSHPNITVVYDYGEIDDKPFIVMEYLEGTELRDLIKNEKPLSLTEQLDLAIQICEGLQYAHSKKIVHRDIKPENIRVVGDHKIKIMDFGIAKLEMTTYTQVGAAMGTPYYMSPEQIVGKKVDKRTDIFAFGVVLHELLTGKRPFNGVTSEAVMYCIRMEEPEISIEGIEFAEDLKKIVLQCLEKERDNRYSGFSKVLQDINKIMNLSQQITTSGIDQSGAGTLTYYAKPKSGILRPMVILPILFFIVFGSLGGWFYYSRPDLFLKGLSMLANLSESAEEPIQIGLPPTNSEDSPGLSPDSNFTDTQQKTDEIPTVDNQTENAEEQESPRIIEPKTKPNPLVAQVDRAEENMKITKRNVIASPDDKQADGHYQQALEKEKAAQRQVSAGNLQAAVNSLVAAADLFAKAPASILKAQKNKADQARTAMEIAKGKVDKTEGGKEGNYQKGLQTELEGKRAYDQQSYTSAKDSYQTASMLYTQANVDVMLRKTAEMQRRLDVDKAIQAVTDAYKRSLEKGDIEGLRSLYANFNKEEEQQWSNVFKLIKNRRVVIAPAKRQIISDNSVVIDLLVGVFYKDNRNEERKINYEYQWTLENINGNWLIAKFAVSNISNE